MPPDAVSCSDTPAAGAQEETPTETTRTTVRIRACGRFRRRFDETRFEFTFEGERLRGFLGALLAERPDIANLLIGETQRGDDAGWTDLQDDIDEEHRPLVRSMINGTFNEYRGGAEAEFSDGDRVEPLTY